MPRTPDSFPGTRYEDSIVFSSGSSFPLNSGELGYATGTVSGSGFFVNEGSDIRRIANPTMSGGIGIIFGVNIVSNAVTASVDNRVVATLTGSVFTGPVVAQGGLSGSLQRLSTGETYLAQGTNVTIVTQSNGQIVISATGEAGPAAPTAPISNELGELFLATVTGSVYRKSIPIVSQQGWLVNDLGMMLVMTSSVEPNYLTAGTVYVNGQGADISASYITMGLTSSLPNERSLAVGTGLAMADAGANNTVTLSIKNDVVATISGSNFTGPVLATGGLSGSLQRTTAGLSYIVGGTNVTVVSQSNGQIVVNAEATPSLTGSAGSYDSVQVNEYGNVTSGSLSPFGSNFWFVAGDYTSPATNSSAVYASALAMTASNLTPGRYRLGWSFNYFYNIITTSYFAAVFVGTSSSWEIVQEPKELGANERGAACGFQYIVITGSVQTFDIRQRAESGTTVSRMYDRALELWKVG